jgi:hypothetical protein
MSGPGASTLEDKLKLLCSSGKMTPEMVSQMPEELRNKCASFLNASAKTKESSSALTITPELKAGDSKKEKSKTCLFGGIPSYWKDFGEAGIKCTRPDESSNENCKKEDGNFQCPSHSIELSKGSIDKELCIKTISYDDITIRCTKTLLQTLGSKKASIKAEEEEAFLKGLKEVYDSLLANDRMKDESGEHPKSIFAYCAADSVAQVKECSAIQEVLTLLKTAGIESIYQARAVAAANKPARPVKPGEDPATSPIAPVETKQ